MSAEAAIDALRGELPFLWPVVGPRAPVTNHLEGNIIVKSNIAAGVSGVDSPKIAYFSIIMLWEHIFDQNSVGHHHLDLHGPPRNSLVMIG